MFTNGILIGLGIAAAFVIIPFVVFLVAAASVAICGFWLLLTSPFRTTDNAASAREVARRQLLGYDSYLPPAAPPPPAARTPWFRWNPGIGSIQTVSLMEIFKGPRDEVAYRKSLGYDTADAATEARSKTVER